MAGAQAIAMPSTRLNPQQKRIVRWSILVQFAGVAVVWGFSGRWWLGVVTFLTSSYLWGAGQDKAKVGQQERES